MQRKRPSWYVDPKFIRPKVRHSWTDVERKKIYTLRMAGQSVDEIIRALKLHNITRIKIYNIIRGERNTRKGRCSCGAKLTTKEVYEQRNNVSIKCTDCLKKNSILKRTLRQKYLRKGLCGICGRNKRLRGHKTCVKCLSADYRRSYIKKLCGRCHVNPISKESISLCNTCLDVNRKHIQAYRKRIHEHSNNK